MSLNLFTRFASDRWPLIPLRLIVGYGFMEHGFAKLAKGPDAFANILQAIGVPAPHFMAWSTILVEILGGLAVILGAFITLASFIPGRNLRRLRSISNFTPPPAY